jgi:hypothetical protein
VSMFDLSREAFSAVQAEMGESLRLIRGAAYPLTAVLIEKHVQTLEDDGSSVVDDTAMYIDVAMDELAAYGLGGLEHGDRIMKGEQELLVVTVMDRMGYQRARLHQRRSNGRTW